MNGTAHATIGATTGFIVANTFNTTPSTTLILVALGGVSGLVPDLDIGGKLRGKITFSHKVIQKITQLIGILLIVSSVYGQSINENWLSIGIGLGILIGSSLIKQRHMLTISGIGVLTGGFYSEENWLVLFGIYILVASFVPHRSYTHSILGVIFYAIIASKLELAVGIDGVFYTCLVGYISHLVADLKLLPFNKRGIKLFLPVSSKEL